MRSSKQKEVILSVLGSTRAHPTAQWIYEEARRLVPQLSLGTVYRNLKVLCELGEVDELRYGKYPSRYEIHANRHHHVRCVVCGRVDDVACDDVRQPLAEAARHCHYEMVGHHVQILGICPACQAARDRKA